ncbi:hypothetical protein H4582DRAFT_2056341 [Lactarius indigo]|nr:hypothetical protein H4582DRAFT_2056341 [Lactarius indigo]
MTTISSSCCDDDVTTLPTPNGGGSGTNPETTTTTSPEPPKVAAATAPAPEPQGDDDTKTMSPEPSTVVAMAPTPGLQGNDLPQALKATTTTTTTTTTPRGFMATTTVLPRSRQRLSEAMSLIQLFVPAEVAHNTVSELGELPSILTPPKLNPDVNPFQRSFVGEICRIEEMPHRVRFFPTQIDREHASRRWPVAPAFSRANRPRARIKEMARCVRFFPRKSTASTIPFPSDVQFRTTHPRGFKAPKATPGPEEDDADAAWLEELHS